MYSKNDNILIYSSHKCPTSGGYANLIVYKCAIVLSVLLGIHNYLYIRLQGTSKGKFLPK